MTDRETKIRELSRAVRPTQAAPVRRDAAALKHRDGSDVNGVQSSEMGIHHAPFAGDDDE